MHFSINEKQDFLTTDEVNKLRGQVYDSKKYWKHISSMPVAFEENVKKFSLETITYYENMLANQYFLGDAIYVMNNQIDTLNTETQTYMKQKFAWVYEKLLNYFKVLYNNERVILHEKLPIPGFHIFSNVTDTPTGKTHFDWHNDTTISDYVGGVKSNSIYSFVLLVQNIEDFSHLDYEMKGIQNILPYKETVLHMWNGNIRHKIGSMKLNPNEARITLQGHLYFDENDNYYKLYF